MYLFLLYYMYLGSLAHISNERSPPDQWQLLGHPLQQQHQQPQLHVQRHRPEHARAGGLRTNPSHYCAILLGLVRLHMHPRGREASVARVLQRQEQVQDARDLHGLP